MKVSQSKKNVLVTGADGFIGSHLVEQLVKDNYNVKALVYYNSFNNWGWLEQTGLMNEIEVVCGDIRDSNFCRKISKGIDTIYNLAALIAIPYSYMAPESYIDVNVKGTLNICQAALDNGVSKLIQVSTSEVYGTAKYVPIDEKHPLQPQSPYSASKIGSDSIAMSFKNAFDLPVVLARPFNTYGPRQSARAVIPSIIIQILSGVKKIKLGDLNPTRDFNYVLDTCLGLRLLGECDKAIGEVINIGSNFEISIFDTVQKIKNMMNRDVEIIVDQKRMRPKNSEVNRLWCDNSKIFNFTGFKPSYTIDEGLKCTIDWFSKNENLVNYKDSLYNV